MLEQNLLKAKNEKKEKTHLRDALRGLKDFRRCKERMVWRC